LRFRQANTQYPFETDVAFEWWLWQHLPFVFAVWAIRKDAAPQEKKLVEAALMRALTVNMGQLDVIAREHASSVNMSAPEVQAYLENFVYRLGPSEEEAITRFEALVNEHHLL
jgi:chorismate dehydratase